jgi:hypothetical protein
MGYKQNGFLLHSSWIVDRDRVGEWTDATFISQRILGPLAQERVLAQLDHVSVMTAPAIPLPSFEALDELVKSGDNQALFMFAGSQDDPDALVHITITRMSVDIGIGTISSAISPEFRERISMWMQSWSLSLAELHCRLSSAVFGPPGNDYPRPRPPRRHDFWQMGALDLYLGRSWHAQSEERRQVLETIKTAPIPASARRTSEGDIVRIAFEVDLHDAAAVSATRRAQEDWLTPLVPAELERGWNELGDRMAVVVRPAEKEPFTFYDPRYLVGYKAMIVDPESGEIDEEMWAELRKIARDGKAPDGTELKGVRLIFPVRENALAMHARAIADGFEMATYPGNPGIFWQVNPP